MRPGWYRIGGLKMIQHMVFQEGPRAGEAKGLKVVCSERFGPEAVEGIFYTTYNSCIFQLISSGLKHDDLAAMLRTEEDFMSSKPILQEKLEELGCKLIFGVKFHPEFMMIESCYRYCKIFTNWLYINPFNWRNVCQFMKTKNVIGCSRGFVDRVLDSDTSVTPNDVQKYFLNTLKYMKFYEEVCSLHRSNNISNIYVWFLGGDRTYSEQENSGKQNQAQGSNYDGCGPQQERVWQKEVERVKHLGKKLL